MFGNNKGKSTIFVLPKKEKNLDARDGLAHKAINMEVIKEILKAGGKVLYSKARPFVACFNLTNSLYNDTSFIGVFRLVDEKGSRYLAIFF